MSSHPHLSCFYYERMVILKTLEQQNKLKRMIVEQLHEFTKLHFTYMFKRFLFKVCLNNYHENISKMNLCFGFWPFISE